MAEGKVTSRDEEYLRTIFLLNGENEPVSPTRLARRRGITKVSSYQKMRRLEKLGLGSYVARKGFLLNSRGASLVSQDIHRHHVLETFIVRELGLSSRDACQESSRMGRHVSPELVKSISEKLGDTVSCDCGCCLNLPYDPDDLVNCHWCKPHLHEPGARTVEKEGA